MTAHPQYRLVHIHDLAMNIDDHNAVPHGLEHGTQLLFRFPYLPFHLLAFGDVPQHHGQSWLALIRNRLEVSLHRYHATILAIVAKLLKLGSPSTSKHLSRLFRFLHICGNHEFPYTLPDYLVNGYPQEISASLVGILDMFATHYQIAFLHVIYQRAVLLLR